MFLVLFFFFSFSVQKSLEKSRALRIFFHWFRRNNLRSSKKKMWKNKNSQRKRVREWECEFIRWKQNKKKILKKEEVKGEEMTLLSAAKNVYERIHRRCIAPYIDFDIKDKLFVENIFASILPIRVCWLLFVCLQHYSFCNELRSHSLYGDGSVPYENWRAKKNDDWNFVSPHRKMANAMTELTKEKCICIWYVYSGDGEWLNVLYGIRMI